MTGEIVEEAPVVEDHVAKTVGVSVTTRAVLTFEEVVEFEQRAAQDYRALYGAIQPGPFVRLVSLKGAATSAQSPARPK